MSGGDGLPPVVLLHGLGRTPASLFLLARRLRSAGHQTFAPGYPSRRLGVLACAARLHPQIAAFQDRTGGRDIAFVTHSMGGLVARALLADARIRAAAIVMLAPPNGGSEVADRLRGLSLPRAVLGPALDDLRTTPKHRLPIPSCPVGIIAGTRSYFPLTSRVLPSPNDGLVTLDRTRLDGADWLALPLGHTFLMNNPVVADAVLAFLRKGRFPDDVRLAAAGWAVS